ncbi:serine hydrolase domain-containing protein [Plantibacter sp. YIM 135347]|uniref:serine hydrolase domain-containing protein n=1 Tax=Plantibacter sp. YIM 135347 TaxID=3423919 RepID=UPI003D3270F7
MIRSRSTLVIALAAAVATAVVGVLLIPRPTELSADVSGDEAIIATVRKQLTEIPGARERVSVAVIDGDRVRTANFGATDTTEYEIGSVTKTVTGSLLADAIARGEVEATTKLGDLLDLGDSPASTIRLEELATQTSGLPAFPQTGTMMFSAILSQLRAGDPYPYTADELVEAAKDVELGPKEFVYSNLGMSLLGHAVAAAAGTDWATLAADRIFTPLQMESTTAPNSLADLRQDAPTGRTNSGRPAAPWTLSGNAPAGSIRSTLADMTKYARAQLDGTAPGADAATPRVELNESAEIGYAWITQGDVTWHNGGTGGFATWVGFDRDRDRAVVVLTSTASAVDPLGLALMEVQ